MGVCTERKRERERELKRERELTQVWEGAGGRIRALHLFA